MAGQYTLRINQGANLDKTITWKDSAGVLKVLTGFTAELQVRFKKDSSSILVTMKTSDSTIVLGGVLGTIQLLQTAAQTAAYTFASALYDLELTSSGGVVTRLLEGPFLVSKEVTR